MHGARVLTIDMIWHFLLFYRFHKDHTEIHEKHNTKWKDVTTGEPNGKDNVGGSISDK